MKLHLYSSKSIRHLKKYISIHEYIIYIQEKNFFIFFIQLKIPDI